MWACTSPATLCMVLVQMRMKSAPARSSPAAACPRISPLRAQSPLDWHFSISSKSTLWSTILAEWSPPSFSFTASLMSW